MANTLFDKIWDAHVVQLVEDGPTQLYIDRLYCHEVTSPQAFEGLRARGIKCFRPENIYCMPDHNTPTHDQDKPIEDPVSKTQVDTLAKNAADFGLSRGYFLVCVGPGLYQYHDHFHIRAYGILCINRFTRAER